MVPTDVIATSWTECSVDGTSCITYTSTSSPAYFRESGDIVFILSWILFLLALNAIGMIFNSFHKTPS